MKKLIVFFLFISVAADAGQEGRILKYTQKTLLKYKPFKNGTERMLSAIKSETEDTFGDYADEFMIIATPLVMGEVKVDMFDADVYYNFRREEAGLKYTYRF